MLWRAPFGPFGLSIVPLVLKGFSPAAVREVVAPLYEAWPAVFVMAKVVLAPLVDMDSLNPPTCISVAFNVP